MHRVAETERAESWQLEKELEHLELFFHQLKASSAMPSPSWAAPGEDFHPFPPLPLRCSHQAGPGEAFLDKKWGWEHRLCHGSAFWAVGLFP